MRSNDSTKLQTTTARWILSMAFLPSDKAKIEALSKPKAKTESQSYSPAPMHQTSTSTGACKCLKLALPMGAKGLTPRK
jgi:hypothetical protein